MVAPEIFPQQHTSSAACLTFLFLLSSHVMLQLHYLPDRTGYKESRLSIMMVPGYWRMVNSQSSLIQHGQQCIGSLVKKHFPLIYFSLEMFLARISSHKKEIQSLPHAQVPLLNGKFSSCIFLCMTRLGVNSFEQFWQQSSAQADFFYKITSSHKLEKGKKETCP